MTIADWLDHHRRISLAILAGILLLLHLGHLGYPPNGYHQWRESDTAAVIQNYYAESMNPLEPRINQRSDQSGITGSELPVYEYVSALGYRMVGSSHVISRTISLAMLILAVVLLYRLAADRIDTLTGLGAAAALAFSPLAFFYGGKIMPDATMLALTMGGVLAYNRYIGNRRTKYLLLACICLASAGAIKPLALSTLLVLLYWTITDRDRRPGWIASFGLFAAAVTALAFGWYAHADQVNDLNHSEAFDLTPHWALSWQRIHEVGFYKTLLYQWPLELWINYALVPVFVVGLIGVIREQSKRWILIWIAGAYIVFALTATHSSTHDYYTLIIVPAIAVISGVGLASMLRARKSLTIVGLVLLTAAPAVAYLRVKHRIEPVPDFQAIRQTVGDIIPQDALVMVEDDTPAIRLYQLDRHGWPMRMGIDSDHVSYCIGRGARYLVTVRPLEQFDANVRPLLDTTAERIGPYYMYRAKDRR